jgi:hypothetical protein
MRARLGDNFGSMARAPKDSRAGGVLNERYELRELIASGAVSDAYRADDRKHPQSVQVTLLRPEFALQAGVVQRFLLAGKVLSGFSHPNVARVIAIETDDTGIPFVVEELLDGPTLAERLRDFGDGMALDAAADVVMPVLEALCALHARGLWHGQLDSDHVVMAQVGARSLPKLVGFAGVAKAQPRAGARNRMPPEQRDGKGAGDARADVWSVGALLHEALCGVPPGEASDTALLKARAPNLAAPIVALIEGCIARDPSARPSRVEDVRLALAAACGRVARPSTEPAAPKARSVEPRIVEKIERRSVEPKSVKPAPAPATPAAAPPAESIAALAQTKPDPELDFALGATMFQQPAPRISTPRAEAPAPRATPVPAAPPDVAATRELRGAPSQPGRASDRATAQEPAAPGPRKVKTLDDIAAAFGPIEGAERIVQSESNEASRAREFRNSMDAAAEAEVKKRPRRRDDAGVQATGPARDEARAAPPPPLLSRKHPREAAGPPPQRAPSAEETRQVRERLMAAQPRRWRAFGDGLLLAFSVALIWFLPLLTDASHARAKAAFGAPAPHVLAAFVVVATIALVRTWAVNAQLRPMMLGQATFALQIVVVCACVLCAGFYLPSGAIGGLEGLARWAMPWAASGFFLFLGMYGVLRGVRDSASNVLTGVLVAVLYSGGFYGSYRAIADGVLQGKGLRGSGAALLSVGRAREASDALQKAASGQVQSADAGVKLQERHEIGASEKDDLRGVDELRRRDPKLGELQKKMQALGKAAE